MINHEVVKRVGDGTKAIHGENGQELNVEMIDQQHLLITGSVKDPYYQLYNLTNTKVALEDKDIVFIEDKYRQLRVQLYHGSRRSRLVLSARLKAIKACNTVAKVMVKCVTALFTPVIFVADHVLFIWDLFSSSVVSQLFHTDSYESKQTKNDREPFDGD